MRQGLMLGTSLVTSMVIVAHCFPFRKGPCPIPSQS